MGTDDDAADDPPCPVCGRGGVVLDEEGDRIACRDLSDEAVGEVARAAAALIDAVRPTSTTGRPVELAGRAVQVLVALLDARGAFAEAMLGAAMALGRAAASAEPDAQDGLIHQLTGAVCEGYQAGVAEIARESGVAVGTS